MAINSDFHPVTQPMSSGDVCAVEGVESYNDIALNVAFACQAEEAETGAIVLVASQDYLEKLDKTLSISIITTRALADKMPEQCAVYTSDNPRMAFAQILAHLYKQAKPHHISDKAVIAPSAQIGAKVSIGDYAIIEEGAVIADDVVVGPHVTIGANCQIGADSVIDAYAHITFSTLGAHVHIGSHSVIGSEGFGFEMTKTGAVMLPHLGIVEIGENVRIGAHSAIDRGVLGPTKLGANVMIDNHVHIAHNVQIGHNSILLAQVGIAGSSVIGKNCILAGKVGVKDHVTVADGCTILSAARVVRDLSEAGTYGGFPAVPAKQHWRELAALKRLALSKSKGK